MKRHWFTAALAVAVIAMGVQASHLLRADPSTTPQARDAEVARRVAAAPGHDEREPAPPPSVASANGVVEPSEPETRVGASVTGQIARVTVTEGQHVTTGEVIVELDRRVEAAQLAAADADVAAARAELDRLVHGTRGEDVRAARAEAEGARARATYARETAKRTEKAASSGALTTEELERSRSEADAADAAVRSAQARLDAAIAGSRSEDLQLARAKLAGSEARRDQAAALYNRLQVVSPATGEVLRLPYRAGEYYQPGSQGAEPKPLALIGDTSRLRVRLDIDERDIARVELGARVVVRSSAVPDAQYPGKVVELARRMGRKNIRTDDPVERIDTKIREVVVALDDKPPLVVGQRVVGYVLAP